MMTSVSDFGFIWKQSIDLASGDAVSTINWSSQFKGEIVQQSWLHRYNLLDGVVKVQYKRDGESIWTDQFTLGSKSEWNPLAEQEYDSTVWLLSKTDKESIQTEDQMLLKITSAVMLSLSVIFCYSRRFKGAIHDTDHFVRV